MNLRTITTLSALVLASVSFPGVANEIPRTSEGRPDMGGYYDVATLTPLQRPAIFGDSLYLTPEQAERIRERERRQMAEASKDVDPDREAPPAGGDGSSGAAGNVGGYNAFWVDRGDDTVMIDGKFRTSIIYDPANGRYPEFTDEARKAWAARRSFFRENTGEAWWLKTGGPGPYDDPEVRPLSERCLLGFGSTSGPPMLPTLYNNVKRIIQTPDHVVILNEMVHDARIIRLNDEHAPSEVRKSMGDSVGHWEGDTLVVDTTNFTDQPGLRGASSSLHVVERFSMQDAETLMYDFTVEDPTVWKRPWRGQYTWPRTDSVVYEYACHEANYAMGNVLRGARLLEKEAREAGDANGGE